MKILFVCTGNTCRSPMAEALCTSLFQEKGVDIAVESRGTSVLKPQRASENAALLMEQLGLSLASHFSRPISVKDVEEADLILTMAESHKRVLKKVCTEGNTPLFTLKEFVGEEGEISDPFGQGLACYDACAKEIIACLMKLYEKLMENEMEDPDSGLK